MYEQVSQSPVEPAGQVAPLLFSDEDLAAILGVTTDWIRSHAGEIPGFKRLGRYFRFGREVVERWLGSLEPLFDAKRVSQLMSVPESWVYANANDIPGVLRLGHYVRFKPSVLVPFLNGSEVVQ